MKLFFSLIALCTSFSLFAEGNVILEMDGITFTDEELIAAVADQDPAYQENLKANIDALDGFLKRLFVSRLIAEKNKAELLKDKNTKIALQLSQERNIHNMLVKKAYLEKVKNIDFKKLAETEYAANADKYKTAFSVDFYHILFLKHNNLSDIDPKKKAEEVLADIESGKVTMSEMAKKYQMPLAGVDENGVIKNASLEGLMPKIVAVLKTQNVNEVSEVIETETGFHIVSLSKVNKPETIKYHQPLQNKIIAGLSKDLEKNVISSVAMPYKDLEKYTIHQDALNAVFDKIQQSK